MQDEITTVAKITPAAGGAFYSLYGWTLNEWVAAATLLYIVAQIGLLVPKYWAVIFRKETRK